MISGVAEWASAAGEAEDRARFSIWQEFDGAFRALERHLLDEILVFANLIQIPAVILTAAGAALGSSAGRYGAGSRAWVEAGFGASSSRLGSYLTVMGDRQAGAADYAGGLGAHSVCGFPVAVAGARPDGPHARSPDPPSTIAARVAGDSGCSAAALVPYAALGPAESRCSPGWWPRSNIVHLLGADA